MSLNLDESQLMMSMANVIVADPVFAKKLMELAENQKRQQNILKNLRGVFAIVSEQCELNEDKKTYMEKLKIEAGKIKDSDVSTIMMRAVVECKKIAW